MTAMKFRKEKDNLGFSRSYYNKVSTLGLEIHRFTNSRDWLIFLHQREENHCIISAFVWGHILTDKRLYEAVDPVAKHSELLLGHLGTLTFGSAPYTKVVTLFTDAYSHPDSDNRIFDPLKDKDGSFILVPKDRQVILKEDSNVEQN